MYAENLNAQLLKALDRPDLRVVSGAQRISFDASLDTAFRADPGREVVLGAACLGTERVCAFHIRHALELSMLLDAATGPLIQTPDGVLAYDLPILAGLCAARTASLFWQLDGPSDETSASLRPCWLEAMAGETMPSRAVLNSVWARVRNLQGSSYRLLRAACLGMDDSEVPVAVLLRLEPIWDLLGPAEWLMAQGGDQRLAVDPRTGLNHYGCSHRPRPWAITFASSTASSLSERGFGGAEACRRRIAAAAFAGCAPTAMAFEAAAVRSGIATHYGLSANGSTSGIASGSEVVLAASGTDCELLALALAERRGPVSSILTAPEETGTGVPLAAAGRHFASDTSGRQQVRKGAVIDGFRGDARVLALAVRHADGTLRTASQIETDCAELVAAERQVGRRILLHLLDLSKTGLLAPSLACLERLQTAYGDGIDIVVDACQARLDQRRVRDYLARGWMVMITGSKFFTGPPFCGAVLLPRPIADRLSSGVALPIGLSAYGCRTDWPDWMLAASHLPAGINLGMVLRWQAALAEMQAFAAVPAEQLHGRLDFFLNGVREAIGLNPDLVLIEVPAADRALLPSTDEANPESPGEQSWDQLQTILSFLVLEPGRARVGGIPLTMPRARQLYRWLNADVRHVLSETASEDDRRLAGLLCHIGQPAPVSHPALTGQPAGALRISAGARLLSGEPSHEGLDIDRRLAREVADARRALDKITLLLRHWVALQIADPEPTYAPRCYS